MTDSSSGTHVQLQGLAKHYGAREVLSGLELTLTPGSFVAVIGRSGCGKSTLLRVISGLERPSAGATLIDGRPLAGLNREARVMFQDGRLLLWKTVIGNVGLGLRGAWRPRAHGVLEEVGLRERADDWISSLSGGQRQRVALAKAMITRPRLLLLDEPLGALDALTRIEMQQLIEGLWQEQGFTTVLVTHDVEEAVALADRILVLKEGRISLDLENRLARPRTRGNPAFASLTERILEHVLGQGLERPAALSGNGHHVHREASLPVSSPG